MLLTPAQIKQKSVESRWNSFFFLPGVDVSYVCMCAWALGCFHSFISTRTFGRALTASVDSCAEIKSAPRLQALVYDILLSTTAVFSYAIRSRKLSANEHFFCWCSNSSKFVTNNSNKTRPVIHSRQQCLHQHKQKPQSFESRRNSFFHPGWMRLMFTWVLWR